MPKEQPAHPRAKATGLRGRGRDLPAIRRRRAHRRRKDGAHHAKPDVAPELRPSRVHRLSRGGEEYAVLVLERSSPPQARSPLASLSPAERAVCELLLQGLPTAAVARRRGTSVHTVSNQIASIYRALGVSSRRELCARYGSSLDAGASSG